MAHNILLTNVSGYLGGTLLHEWKTTGPSNYGTISALVRNGKQAKEVARYGVEPLIVPLKDENAIVKALVERNITIVYYLIGSYWLESQLYFVKGLAEVKRRTGDDVHFPYVHTAGCPTDRPIYDNDPNLYDIQSKQQGYNEELTTTHCAIINESEERGIRVYLFSPCIVYGKGTGFGNKISIQTVDIVMAFKSLGHAYNIQEGRPDTISLYFFLLSKTLDKEKLPYGKRGCYLCSPGLIAWDDVYTAITGALYRKGIIDSPDSMLADDKTLQEMRPALGIVGKSSVMGKIGGVLTYTPKHAEEIGWKPKHQPGHILETAVADAEVEAILSLMNDELKNIR